MSIAVSVVGVVLGLVLMTVGGALSHSAWATMSAVGGGVLAISYWLGRMEIDRRRGRR